MTSRRLLRLRDRRALAQELFGAAWAVAVVGALTPRTVCIKSLTHF